MMGLGFGFGGIFMILFWGLIIWAIFGLVGGGRCGLGHCGRSNGGHRHSEKDAYEILRERYAKGEISKEEFERMKKDLQ